MNATTRPRAEPMARDLRTRKLHCDPVLAPACNVRRRRFIRRYDVLAVAAWSACMGLGGFVAGVAVGGVL